MHSIKGGYHASKAIRRGQDYDRQRYPEERQKNGDIYIMERQTLYDPEKKYNRILSSRLIAKIPKGEKTPVPTRSKRPKGEKLSQSRKS